MVTTAGLSHGSLPPSPSPDETPFERIDGDVGSGLLFLCDHASNALPARYGTLGLPEEQLRRHIGYDIGARGLTLRLARAFGAPAVLTTYSRLLIDPNRGEDDPTLVMRLSDGAVVPGNARHDVAERAARLDAFHRPYHRAIAAQIDKAIAAGHPPAIVSIHSFTDVWRGVPRPWQVGILWDRDPRFCGAAHRGTGAGPNPDHRRQRAVRRGAPERLHVQARDSARTRACACRGSPGPDRRRCRHS